MDSLIPPSEADRILTASLVPLGHETVPLAHAIGRQLSTPILADRPLPPYRRAMMDGIAFHSDSTPPFTIAGLHAAGSPPPRQLQANEAWEIMTGAQVPDDCDTLVPYEELTPDHRTPTSEPTPGTFIHEAGSDADTGQTLVPANSSIGPAEVAIAASVGLTELQVTTQPRIGLLTTGDKAIPITEPPQPWQIRRSNGAMLESLLTHRGHPPVLHHHLPDDEALTHSTLECAFKTTDLLILCGGISKGKKDHIRPVLESLLGPPAFHGVRQRPGKPLAFWPGPPLIFALPGNPVSVLATFTRYLLPTLARLEGKLLIPRSISFPEASPLPKLTWLLPIKLTPEGSIVPLPPRNSGDFTSISTATGIIELPPATDFQAKRPVPYFPFTEH